MEMEDLNKSQIVLLTLLVSFITSIATGIVTVSLMNQAPEGITKTITHVVERTVEQVAPGDSEITTIIKEVPIVVTEEELVLKAINIVSPAVVLVREVGSDGKVVNPKVSTAFIVNKSGRLVTAGRLINQNSFYEIILENKEIFPVDLKLKNSTDELAVFDIKEKNKNDFLDKTKTITPLNLIDGAPVIGQSVIGVGATTLGSHSVAMGIVSNFFNNASSTATFISTGASTEELVGGPLVDIKGNVVGINIKSGVAVGRKLITTTLDSIKQ